MNHEIQELAAEVKAWQKMKQVIESKLDEAEARLQEAQDYLMGKASCATGDFDD